MKKIPDPQSYDFTAREATTIIHEKRSENVRKPCIYMMKVRKKDEPFF